MLASPEKLRCQKDRIKSRLPDLYFCKVIEPDQYGHGHSVTRREEMGTNLHNHLCSATSSHFHHDKNDDGYDQENHKQGRIKTGAEDVSHELATGQGQHHEQKGECNYMFHC